MSICVCYGYGRHSTRHQELTADVQEAKVKEFYRRELRPKGVVWGGFHYDLAISGGKPFSERKHGLNVCAMASPGDYIVSSRLDRCFRNTLDGLRNIEAFKTKGVTFYSLDLPTVFADPLYGKLLLTLLLAFSELDRGITRERTLDTIEYRKKAGLPYCPSAPMGWKIVGVKPHKTFRVNVAERNFIDLLELQRNSLSVVNIARWCAMQSAFKLDRSFSNPSAVQWAFHAKYLGYPKITSFKSIRKLAREARKAAAHPDSKHDQYKYRKLHTLAKEARLAATWVSPPLPDEA